jgi:diamine N-acetyltransferase
MLENDSIKLRALEPEDLDFLYRMENNTALWKYGSTMAPFSRYILHKYIENSHLDLFEARQLRLIIEDNLSGLQIGMADLYDYEVFHNRAGVGILIDEKFQNKNYAVKSLDLLIEYSFDFLKLNQLYAHIPADNIASLRLFRKCGFNESGILKKWNKTKTGYEDVHIYQIIRKVPISSNNE